MSSCNAMDRGQCLNTKVCPRPTGAFWQEILENQNHEEPQMTALEIPLTDAPSTRPANWPRELWCTVERLGTWLQSNIAKVVSNVWLPGRLNPGLIRA
jgi:hypothetical protein